MSMQRNPIPLIAALIGSLLLTSCATRMLWDKTDPHEYVVMKRTPESEARLRERGLDYQVHEATGLLMVEKSNFRKFHDYLTRFFFTPVAVAHDTAVVATVVGAVAYVHSQSGGGELTWDDGSDSKADAELRDLERTMRDFNESKPSGAR